MGTHRLIFIVDISDKHRFDKVREELTWILNSDKLDGVPVVVHLVVYNIVHYNTFIFRLKGIDVLKM